MVALPGYVLKVGSALPPDLPGLPPPPPPCPADLNNDGEVGFADLSVILSAWEESDAGDANGDGQTIFSDLSAVLSAWGSDC